MQRLVSSGRKSYRRRLASYISNAETTGRHDVIAIRVQVLLNRSADWSSSPRYVPYEETMDQEDWYDEEEQPEESPLPKKGPSIIRWAASYNPQVLTTTTSSSYAPGAIGLEGFESTHQLPHSDAGLSGAFLRGVNSHLQVPVGDFSQTLESLVT